MLTPANQKRIVRSSLPDQHRRGARRFTDMLWRRRKAKGAELTPWQGTTILLSMGMLVFLIYMLVYYVWFLPTLHAGK